jgi:hypothetical protein
MALLKKLLLFTVFISLLYACHKEGSTLPDLNSFSGTYVVSGTHYVWQYYFGPGVQPYDSITSYTYNNANDTLLLSEVNDTCVSVSLSDSGVVVTAQLNYQGRSAITGGYIFTGGADGSPDFDSLVVYNGSPNSLYLFFAANQPHSGGYTFQVRGIKAH